MLSNKTFSFLHKVWCPQVLGHSGTAGQQDRKVPPIPSAQPPSREASSPQLPPRGFWARSAEEHPSLEGAAQPQPRAQLSPVSLLLSPQNQQEISPFPTQTQLCRAWQKLSKVLLVSKALLQLLSTRSPAVISDCWSPALP